MRSGLLDAILSLVEEPDWRGRSRYVSRNSDPLHTVHGTGVCEIGASTRMSDDFIVLMLSTDCNREGADQVIPVLHRADTKRCISRTVRARFTPITTRSPAGCTPTCGSFRLMLSWR